MASDPSLADVLRRARAFLALERALARRLPPGLGGQIRVGGAEKGVLTLVAPNAASATRLRMAEIQILDAAAAEGAGLTKLHVRVHPLEDLPEDRAEPRRPSPEAARHLLAAAPMFDDPELRSAIERLARLADGGE